jgi:transcriptional regulator with XRE-family HTH domain
MSHTTMPKKIHEGRNIKRFREMLGVKQDALAAGLGDDWNQQKISLLEQKETIEPGVLQQVSQVLKVPVEAFKNFDEESAITFISNTFHNHDQSSGLNYYPTYNINAFEKWLEVMEENKKLYERLLQAEKEKVALLEKVLEKK